MKQLYLFFPFALILFSVIGQAQVSIKSDLFIQLKTADSLFFEECFNKCNLETLDKTLPEDFEFYHDENGIQNKTQFLKTFPQSICSNPERKPIRKLVEGSLEVFRMKDNGQTYGAIQKGIHLFYIKEPKKEMYLTNIAKFTHVWKFANGEWQLSRVLSYDHQEPIGSYGEKFEANYPLPLFDKDERIEDLLRQHNIPSVSIGYIEDGELTQLRAFGNQQHNVPISTNSIYKIASLTKPIAAFVALKLVDSGELALNDPVGKYYVDPDIKNHPYLTQLTVRHILTHQSGFPNWRYLNETNKLDFEFEPGTQFQYSGEGFEYLRKAIESKLGKSLEEIATETLFGPLGMKSTYFHWSDEVNEHDYAFEHDENGDRIACEKYYEASAAANLMTTARDYSKFMVYLMQGGGLSDSLYTEFLTPQVNQKKGIERNLGMQLLNDLPNGETALMHTGGDYGTKTIAIALLNSQKGLVVFSNSENGMVIWQKIISEYFGEIGIEIARRNLE